jgi:hypothetical protein
MSAMPLGVKAVRPSIRDLLGDDPEVIATETFRPGVVAHEIQRGQRLRLSAPAVRAFPESFLVVIPVDRALDLLDGVIER